MRLITKLIKQLIPAIISSLVLFAIGLGIWLLMKKSQTLQDILFYVGAVPVALFSIGLLGGYAGRGDPSYQLSRSVSNQSSHQRALQEAKDTIFRVKSGLNWLIAGLLLLLFSIFI
jgi:hypothetical protein